MPRTAVQVAAGLTLALTVALLMAAAPAQAALAPVADLPPEWQDELTHEGPLARSVVASLELPPSIRFLTPGAGDEWLEDAPITIRWAWTGPAATVRLYYYGENTRLGGRSRGGFGVVIADRIPNTGSFQWRVPWMDAASFVLRIAAYDEQGRLIADEERGVRFRPAQLAGLEGTFIAVSKSRQRLWYYRDHQIRWISIVSTGRWSGSTPTMRPGSTGRRGAMGQVFSKTPCARSRMFNVDMWWWMAITSSGSHGIHATSPNYYRYLGSPASAGCIRQHRSDAKNLYDMVSVGTPVYIF